jgi:transposase
MNPEEQYLAKKFEIIKLHQEGFSGPKIAAQVKIPKTTVNNIIAKYKKHKTVMRLNGSGRKRKLDQSDIVHLKAYIKENPMTSSKKLSLEIKEKSGKEAFPRKVRNNLK